MADAAGVPGAPAETGGQATPATAAGKETPAQTAARLRLDLGEGEREYDLEHVKGIYQRGRKAAQTLSLAEKRAQEAVKKEQEAEGRIARFKSKDLREVRQALKEVGVDERVLANDVGRDLMEEMNLSPEQKRIRELERKEQERNSQDEKSKAEAEKAKEAAEIERHTEELSTLFMGVLELIPGLPKESARVAFHRVASLYQAAEATGGQVDPELAAERVRAALKGEHKALFAKPDGSWDFAALGEWLGPEAMKQLRREAVAEYKARKAAGGLLQPQPVQPQPVQEPPRKKPGNFWKELKG